MDALGSLMADIGGMNVFGKALWRQSQMATAIYARLSRGSIREAKDKAVAALKMPGRGDKSEP